MAVNKTCLVISLFLSIFLSVGCRTGHFEKTSANTQAVEWQLVKVDSNAGKKKGELTVDLQLRLLLNQEPVKGHHIQAKLTKNKTDSNTFKTITSQSGMIYLRTTTSSQNWLEGDRLLWVLELSDSVLGKQQLKLTLLFSDGVLNLSGNPEKISGNPKALTSDTSTNQRDPFFQLTGSKFFPRNTITLDEEQVPWKLTGELIDRISGEALKLHELKVKIDNGPEEIKHTNSLGVVEWDFTELNRPLDHEKPRKKLFSITAAESLTPIEFTIYYSTDRSRLVPVLSVDTPPPLSLNLRKQAPHLRIEVLSHERVQEPALQWSENFFPRWARLDELRIRPTLWRSLMEREESLAVPGLRLVASLRAWAPENSNCRPFVQEKAVEVELTDGVLVLGARSQFDRPSCLNSNFQWVLELRPLNAPRVQSVQYLIDSQSLKVGLPEGEIQSREIWEPSRVEDIHLLEKSSLTRLVQEALDNFSIPNVSAVLFSQLRLDRNLEKFMEGRSKSMQIRALRTWRWVKWKTTGTQELAISHLRLIDDQDFKRRSWKTTISGDARPCIVLIVEVIPRISRSTYFSGEKRKVRAFCQEKVENVPAFEENLSAFIPSYNNLSAPGDRLIRGIWMPEVGDGTQGTLLAEYDLLTHPELYFWGSTTDSLLIEAPEER